MNKKTISKKNPKKTVSEKKNSNNNRIPKDFKTIISLLKKSTKDNEEAMSEVIAQEFDPFAVLVSCIMSLRTKDTTTLPLARELFKKYSDAQSIAKLPVSKIEKLIYPVSFYKNKAKFIKETCKILIERHNGRVPDTLEELTALKGVGNKCGALTLTCGFGVPDYIAVDVHVQVISTRLGWISSTDPDESMRELMRIIPKKDRVLINNLMVKHGQNICFTLSPKCSQCSIRKHCARIGVTRSR